MKNRFKRFTKRTALVYSLSLTAMLLTTNNLNAQDGGGLFGWGPSSESLRGGGTTGIIINGSDNPGSTVITNNGIGQSEAPLGSGIAILMGAGLGYVALKKKEDEQ